MKGAADVRSVSHETLETELERVGAYLERLGLRWDEPERRRWRAYVQLFEEWADRVNLVSRQDRSRWVERHVLPSLALLEVVPIEPGAEVADVGSGGGFPGLPLALCRTDCRFTLIESKRWRALFLQEAVDRLALAHVRVLGARVEEEWLQREYRGRFRYVLARAVADLPTLWAWTRDLLAEGGELLAYKGEADAAAETRALRDQCGAEFDVEQMPLPVGRGTVIVRIRKAREG